MSEKENSGPERAGRESLRYEMKRIKLQHALMIFFIYNGFLSRFFASFVEKADTVESLSQSASDVRQLRDSYIQTFSAHIFFHENR